MGSSSNQLTNRALNEEIRGAFRKKETTNISTINNEYANLAGVTISSLFDGYSIHSFSDSLAKSDSNISTNSGTSSISFTQNEADQNHFITNKAGASGKHGSGETITLNANYSVPNHQQTRCGCYACRGAEGRQSNIGQAIQKDLEPRLIDSKSNALDIFWWESFNNPSEYKLLRKKRI